MNSPPSLLRTPAEMATRQREVENAILVQALLGRQLTPAIHEQLRRYVVGELSRTEAFADLYNNRENK